MSPDIRWTQRYANFQKAYILLEEAIRLPHPTDLEKEGIIQRFEYTFELAWKTMKDYLEDKGYTEIVGSRDTIRLAFANGIVTDGELWMDMVKDRNLTVHIYNSDEANRIVKDIVVSFFPCFEQLKDFFDAKLT